jgi:N6-adenosine-specific RNA methylase IME4
MLGESALAELAADIKANGLCDAITVFEGQVLDGRNRLAACHLAGVEPRFQELEAGDPAAFVISKNVRRRDLTPGQRVAAVLRLEELVEDLRKGAKRAQVRKPASVSPPVDEQKARQDVLSRVAAATNTSRGLVGQVDRVRKADPELFEKVAAGKVEPKKAERIIKRRERSQDLDDWRASQGSRPVASEPPSVVLADPPWRYEFSETDSRRIESQYPTATVDEIIGHAPATAPDAVLYLWATAPKLLEALRVLDGWGFAYVTHAVWDKEKPGMGYWFRGAHELLLVGTKGAISPPPPEARLGSVLREKRGKHSAKPECAYRLIEAAFPKAAKLEMYARRRREGWIAQGHEAAAVQP